ncbi:50S ribosomal protein L28 [Candidatus Fermentibacteria bacterium]|nr:50S ribosomal protein L28 [Candidatus Fermentibacteria bacterium]
MSRRCRITGKGPMVANRVSHANNRSKRRQLPNLQRKRIWIPEEGRWIRVRVSTRALRTMAKNGVAATLRSAGIIR